METTMFFKMLFALLAIGVFVSLLSGAALPTLSMSLNTTALITPSSTCSSPIPFWCDLTDMGTAVVNIVWSFLSFIYQGALAVKDMILFTTGIGTLITGGTILPSPLDFILLIGITFTWLFLGLEVGRRIIGVVWGR